MNQHGLTGARLRQLRLAAGLSLKAAATLTGYTKGYISALELEHFPITNAASKKLLRVFNADPLPRIKTSTLLDSLMSFGDPHTISPNQLSDPALSTGSTIHGSAAQLSMASIQLFSLAANDNNASRENRTIGILTHRPYGFISQILHIHAPWLDALDSLLKKGYEVIHLLDLRYTKPHEVLQLLRYLIFSFKTRPQLSSAYQIFSFRGSSVSLSHDMFLVPGFGAIIGFPTDSYEMIDSGIYLKEANQLHILERYFSTLASQATPMFTFHPAATVNLEEALHAMDSILYPRYIISHALPSALIPPKQFASRSLRIHIQDPCRLHRVELQSFRHQKQLAATRQCNFRFTLSKAWLIAFLKGEASFPYDDPETPFTQSEAIATVQAVIQHLRILPKLELCLLDEVPADLKEFIWYCVDNRVMLMTMPTKTSCHADLSMIHIDIQERLFVRAFSSLAEDLWEAQPKENRNKEYVLRWMKDALSEAKRSGHAIADVSR